MTAREARGRPKLPAGRARSKVLAIKLRVEELEALRARARAAGLGLSAFVRQALFGGAPHPAEGSSGPTTVLRTSRSDGGTT
jgi:Mobilization protein NikA